MRKPGINMTLGLVLLIVSFGITAPALWGAAQIVKSDEVEDVANGGTGGATGGPAFLNISADNLQYDTRQITVSAGVEVTITLENRESLPHNLAFFTDSNLATVIFRSDLITGPGAVDEFTFTSPSSPGNYFFHCDAHPQMNGAFIVQ